jgi:pilus assembly protein CpaB
MNRRTRAVLALLVGVAAATLASAAVYRVVVHRPVREVEIAHAFMVVAAKPIPMGVRLTKDDVKLIAWPVSSPVTGAFKEPAAVLDRGLIASVVENEPITESKLAPLAAGGGLPPAIRPGMRAISVKVNEVIGVAGFVVPGARVDVVVTIHGQQDAVSRVVVSDVQVLTAGTRYDQEQAKNGQPIPSTVVTLMVDPHDAERIALAATEGQIVLALRNPLDKSSPVTPGVRTATLMIAESSARPTAPRPRAQKTVSVGEVARLPGPYIVEAIRAAKRTSEVVR